MKTCKTCGEIKPLSEYHWAGNGRRRARCRVCMFHYHQSRKHPIDFQRQRVLAMFCDREGQIVNKTARKLGLPTDYTLYMAPLQDLVALADALPVETRREKKLRECERAGTKEECKLTRNLFNKLCGDSRPYQHAGRPVSGHGNDPAYDIWSVSEVNNRNYGGKES